MGQRKEDVSSLQCRVLWADPCVLKGVLVHTYRFLGSGVSFLESQDRYGFPEGTKGEFSQAVDLLFGTLETLPVTVSAVFNGLNS